MKKIIIPRKDHEVYFIPLPEDLKVKLVRPFAVEQLDRLHPAFSASSVFDLQHFVFGGSRWIMVTVMDSETLAEYKILHNNAVFYTNTSIAVNKKGFSNRGICVIDDEYIGYDTEKNEPVSVPLESEKRNDPSAHEVELKSINKRHGVFVENTPWLRVAVMSISIIVLALTTSILVSSTKNTNELKEPEVIPEPLEIKYLPPAIEILAKTSADILNAGGEIIRWQYNEDAEPLMVIQVLGIDVLTVHSICSQYGYMFLLDIQDISYNEGKPFLTVCLNVENTGYAILNTGTFPMQSSTLPMVVDLSKLLGKQEIPIVSETLPTGDNGNKFYTITYTAKDWNLIRSMEIIGNTCDSNHLRVKKLDVSIDGNNNRFTVMCTLSPYDMQNYSNAGLKEDIEKIPKAFGYRNVVLPAFPQPAKIPVTGREPSIVGSIKDGNGKTLFYRDLDSGKFITRGINE